MPKIYRIELSEKEREELIALTRRKRAAAHKVCKARALLFCDEGAHGPGLKDKEIVSKTGIALRTLERLRKRCHEVDPLEALEPVARTHVPRKPKLDAIKNPDWFVLLAVNLPPDAPDGLWSSWLEK